MRSSVKKSQPKGMYIIALTEVFERLGYYMLSFMLVLYACAPLVKGGLGWGEKEALSLAGSFVLLSFALPMFGGFIADKLLGVFPTAIIGALVIISGYVVIGLGHGNTALYLALALVAGGTALFKPCMPTLLGLLYGPTDNRRHSGFNNYYMGINIGGAVAGFSGGLMAEYYGYRACLASAGLGMTIGLLVLLLGRRHLVLEPLAHHDKKHGHDTEVAVAKKRALFVLAGSFVFYAVFMVVYNIVNSGTLTVYIENYTDRTFRLLGWEGSIPTTYFLSLESIGIVLFTPFVTWALAKRALRDKPVHFFSLMNLSIAFSALSVVFFTYLAHQVSGGAMVAGYKPFQHYQMAFLILVVSLAEILISPVMMSAISLLSPERYKTILQAFYLLVIGLTGKLAASLGSYSLENPYEVFLWMSVVTIASTLLYAMLLKPMIRVALHATKERKSHLERAAS